jgi:hypothetical protein
MWNKFECHSCEKGCILFRKCDPYFIPNRCIYDQIGNGTKTSQWEWIRGDQKV